MSTNRSKKAAPPVKRPASKQGPPSRKTAEVRPISPLGLFGAIAAALVIAAILLFVINSRINAANPAAPTARPPAATTPATGTTSAVSGFAQGNANAKVTVTEFGDFK